MSVGIVSLRKGVASLYKYNDLYVVVFIHLDHKVNYMLSSDWSELINLKKVPVSDVVIATM